MPLLSPAVLIVVITATGTAMSSGGWITPVALVAFLVVGIGVPSSVLHMGTMANLYREGQLGATHVESILGEPELAEPQDAVPARSTLVEFDSVGLPNTPWAARPREHLLRDATGHRDRDRWPLRLRKHQLRVDSRGSGT